VLSIPLFFRREARDYRCLIFKNRIESKMKILIIAALAAFFMLTLGACGEKSEDTADTADVSEDVINEEAEL
tara:strand:+ start:647 stop:862 length:216 start_codon:yes stop_codon:yes gene_type:complete